MDGAPIMNELLANYGIIGIAGALAISSLYKQWQDVNITVQSAKASQASASESRELLKQATEEAASAYKEVIESMRQNIASQDETLKRVRTENAGLREANHTLTDDIRRMSDAYQGAMEAIARSEEQRQELIDRLSELQTVVDRVQAENEEMRVKIDRLTDTIAKLRETVDAHPDIPVDNP